MPNDQGRVVYDEHEAQQGVGDTVFSPATTVTLELKWDGQAMSFYANGGPTLHPVPFSGFSDTFGVYRVAGPESSLKVRVDALQVAWK